MTAHINQLYDELYSAIDADELSDATTTLEHLQAEYDETAGNESRLLGRALTARDGGLVGYETQKRIDDFGIRYARTEQNRASVLSSTSVYLSAPNDERKASLLDVISDIKSLESEFDDAKADIESTLTDVEVPGQLEFVETNTPETEVAKGDSVTVGLGVENVGDEDVQDVTISQTSPIDLSPTTVSRAILGGGESISVIVEGFADVPGIHTVQLSAESRDSGPLTEEIDLRVIDKLTAAEEAGSLLNELQTTIEDSDELEGGFEQSLLTKLSSAQRSIARAIDYIGQGATKKANNRLGTSTRQLGAFLNELATADKGNAHRGISVSIEQTLVSLTEAAIGQLMLAKRADL